MTGIKKFFLRLDTATPILPLAIFRMTFGFLMCISQLRFISKGWIEACYIEPEFHFTYQYFGWVHPFDTTTMYAIVIGAAFFALCIGLGLFYRLSTVLFFLSFTYLELIEKSWYLNHYYFVSLVAFLLIWMPAHRCYSLDTRLLGIRRAGNVPLWTLLLLKFQLAVVYFYGGVAKLQYDWLIEAQPLKIWLQAKSDLPLLGSLFGYEATAYVLSWTAALYDLAIPLLLWNRRSRPVAYIAVVTFHLLTYLLFNIGMFPWLMMAGSLIFITAGEWQGIFRRFCFKLKFPPSIPAARTTPTFVYFLLGCYVLFQIGYPLRHFLLTKQLLWAENGLRFAWHVMVMEKNGYAEFNVVDNESHKQYAIYPSQYLTGIQEKQMSFQPDMIWQFGHFLGEEFKKKGIRDVSVYADSRVSLNGRASRVFIDPATDLMSIDYMDEIYGAILPLAEN